MAGKARDIVGERFGRLVVEARYGSVITDPRRSEATWLARCDCGALKVTSSSSLRKGAVTSCGCMKREPRPYRRKSDPGYDAAHKRVYSARGRAAEHTCECGSPAAQWAYDHTDPAELTAERHGYTVPYSADPSYYLPMCARCHVALDRPKEMPACA